MVLAGFLAFGFNPYLFTKTTPISAEASERASKEERVQKQAEQMRANMQNFFGKQNGGKVYSSGPDGKVHLPPADDDKEAVIEN